jgi:hypothetical protein
MNDNVVMQLSGYPLLHAKLFDIAMIAFHAAGASAPFSLFVTGRSSTLSQEGRYLSFPISTFIVHNSTFTPFHRSQGSGYEAK